MVEWKKFAVFAVLSGSLGLILTAYRCVVLFFAVLATFGGLYPLSVLAAGVLFILCVAWMAAAVLLWWESRLGLMLMMMLCTLKSVVYGLLLVFVLDVASSRGFNPMQLGRP